MGKEGEGGSEWGRRERIEARVLKIEPWTVEEGGKIKMDTMSDKNSQKTERISDGTGKSERKAKWKWRGKLGLSARPTKHKTQQTL